MEEAKEEVKTAEEAAQEVTEAIIFSETSQRQAATIPEKARRSFLEKLKPHLEKAEACLAANRLHKIPTVRAEVWKALIGQIISGPIAFKEDAEKIVSRLTTDGYLVKDLEGTLDILGKSYRVHPDSLFEAADLAEVEKKWNGIPKTDKSPRVQGFRDRVTTAINQNSSSSVPDLMAVKPGIYRIFVPPQPPQANSKIWLAGGLLFVESKNGWLLPLDIIGGDRIESVVAEMTRLETKFTIRALHADFPPAPDQVISPDDRIAIEKNNKMRSLWYMVKRGIRFYVWHTGVEKRATLNDSEFFLEGKNGIYLLDNKDVWRDNKFRTHEDDAEKRKRISRPVFLIERGEEDGETFLHILELPEYLKAWLSACMEKYPDTDRFSEVPYPLRKILTDGYDAAAQSEGKQSMLEIDRLVASAFPGDGQTPEPASELTET